MEPLQNEKETANEICVGHVIANLWSKKVKKTISVTKRGSGCENLRRRVVQDYDEMAFREINEETDKKLIGICSKYEGWFFDCVSEGMFQIIKVRLYFVVF